MDKNFVIIVILIIIAVGIYFLNKKSDSDFKNNSIKTLVRQASRWSVASTQDNNVMISVLHANYGSGYLWALRDIATDGEIEGATGIDVLKFRDEIVKVQDDANRKMIATCPAFAPPASYLTNLGSE